LNLDFLTVDWYILQGDPELNVVLYVYGGSAPIQYIQSRDIYLLLINEHITFIVAADSVPPTWKHDSTSIKLTASGFYAVENMEEFNQIKAKKTAIDL